MENRTICKLLINCHSAEHFLINFNCSSTGNYPISLKSKQKLAASRRLRGGKNSTMCLTSYISILPRLWGILFFFRLARFSENPAKFNRRYYQLAEVKKKWIIYRYLCRLFLVLTCSLNIYSTLLWRPNLVVAKTAIVTLYFQVGSFSTLGNPLNLLSGGSGCVWNGAFCLSAFFTWLPNCSNR